MEVDVSFVAEEKGVESLARQIRLTGRAYPLFDIAFLVLKKPERYRVSFSVIKKAEGQPAQPLFLCNLDDTLWTSEAEAMAHVLNNHFATFYQTEKTPADPPKGVYTFVAQCGISGEILGPPNYHDYQTKLRKLHADRFSRMPFEAYKSRVKIVKDPEIVKKWLEDQSWKTEFVTLNVPEPSKFGRMDEVEKHFRETHLANIVRSVDSHAISGSAAQEMACAPLKHALRVAWDQQMRFPLKTVTVLSQQFAEYGLQFFKVNKTVTHVAVARPRYLDMDATPVSDGVRRIVEFISENPKCTRRKLIEALAPGRAASEAPSSGEGAPQPEGAAAPATEAQPAEALPGGEAAPSPEVAAVVSDLHWLIHQGHVTEYANGIMELAKRPGPKPVKKERPTGATAASGEARPASGSSESSGSESGSEPARASESASVPAEESSAAGEPPTASGAPQPALDAADAPPAETSPAPPEASSAQEAPTPAAPSSEASPDRESTPAAEGPAESASASSEEEHSAPEAPSSEGGASEPERAYDPAGVGDSSGPRSHPS